MYTESQYEEFEKRMVDGKRIGLKMILPNEYDLQEQLLILNDKIKKKYATSESSEPYKSII